MKRERKKKEKENKTRLLLESCCAWAKRPQRICCKHCIKEILNSNIRLFLNRKALKDPRSWLSLQLRAGRYKISSKRKFERTLFPRSATYLFTLSLVQQQHGLQPRPDGGSTGAPPWGARLGKRDRVPGAGARLTPSFRMRVAGQRGRARGPCCPQDTLPAACAPAAACLNVTVPRRIASVRRLRGLPLPLSPMLSPRGSGVWWSELPTGGTNCETDRKIPNSAFTENNELETGCVADFPVHFPIPC